MTNREAMERGMAAIEQVGEVSVNKTRTKATPNPHSSSDVAKAGADQDAKAWNMLRHLSGIL